MGLSCQQVSIDGQDWSQNHGLELPTEQPPKQQGKKQQRQQEALKCPRCDSINTKFCYYNNYNQSQPRYFCKACKRHWTKGGTLRNVPVGGARKNKRIKKRTTTTEPMPNSTAYPRLIPTVPDQNPFNGISYNSNPLLQQPSYPNNNNNDDISANGFMGSVRPSPLLPLPYFPSQTNPHPTTNPYEGSSFNTPDRHELYLIDTDPLFDNRKQRQLPFPSLSDLNPAPFEEELVPANNQAVTTPWQTSATCLLEPDSSFWNAGEIWALLSNVGGSDAKQEESNLTTEEGFQETV